MEREKGFEPSTLALARRCSTTELFPLSRGLKKRWDSTETGWHCQGAQSKNSVHVISLFIMSQRVTLPIGIDWRLIEFIHSTHCFYVKIVDCNILVLGPLVQELLIDSNVLNSCTARKLANFNRYISILYMFVCCVRGLLEWFGYCDSEAPLCQRTFTKWPAGLRITSFILL